MNPEDSLRQRADAQARLLLVIAAAEGKLDDLHCPQCGYETVSVFFARPSSAEYHTWFACSNCGFTMRAQNSAKPAHYSLDRDRTGQKVSIAEGNP